LLVIWAVDRVLSWRTPAIDPEPADDTFAENSCLSGP
jgi:hypothetical protein